MGLQENQYFPSPRQAFTVSVLWVVKPFVPEVQKESQKLKNKNEKYLETDKSI